jgi:hypothetical protein
MLRLGRPEHLSHSSAACYHSLEQNERIAVHGLHYLAGKDNAAKGLVLRETNRGFILSGAGFSFGHSTVNRYLGRGEGVPKIPD